MALAGPVGVVILGAELASGRRRIVGVGGVNEFVDGVLHAGIAGRTRLGFAGRRKLLRLLKVVTTDSRLDPFVHLLRLLGVVARRVVGEVVWRV